MFKFILCCLLVACYAEGASFNPAVRILGGQDAPDGAFPYQVSMRRTTWIEFHFCGGSIIRPTWILTAAHCTYSIEASAVTVVAGSNLLSSGGDRYNVDHFVSHENFEFRSLRDDIALLKLTSEIKMGPKVAPIPLAMSPTPPGTECVLSGWGYNEDDQSPNELQMLTVSTIDLDKCRNDLKRYQAIHPVTENQICTVSPRNGQGECEGDSGGPLAASGSLVGIVSYGVRPCGLGFPDVFTNVYMYLDWINGKLD